jgi:PrtD family type I secretion system ABC transporter
MRIVDTWRNLAPELRAAFSSCRAAFFGVGAVSGIINILMLTGPLFMLQVYDRVLPSRSLATLIGLCLFALLLFLFLGALDALRGRVLARVARCIESMLAPRVFDTVIGATIARRMPGDELRVTRDLDSIRSFLAGPALPAFFDLPWMPIYVGICLLFHPLIGWLVLLGAIALCAVTYVTEVLSREPERALRELSVARREVGETARRNAELVKASGMSAIMRERFVARDCDYQDRQQWLSDIGGGFGSISRTFRMILQSAVLALGAYLVINQQATAGVMLAATILSIRALAPVETVIANWRSFVAARHGATQLSETLQALPPEPSRVPLPAPSKSLRVTSLTLAAPGTQTVVLHDVTFALTAGSALGVIGPTGSGKSSLARALIGAWTPARGAIRLDGARLDQWNSDALGSSIGYLPQTVELFEGSVAENIARFMPQPDGKALLDAAQAAAVHDVVLRLPDGYQTQVGEGGAFLSGGQRQRLALARALFGQPFLVVLDEPNANLDNVGEAALARAIAAVKTRGGIAIVITHRPAILSFVDHILLLNEGRAQAFGAREQIAAALATPGRPPKWRAGHVQPVA